MRKRMALALAIWSLCGLSCSKEAPPPAAMDAAASPLQAAVYGGHLRELSSDAYEGRGPGTPGARKTRDYIVGQLESFGLRPGVGGSWIQDVPLRRVTTKVEETRVLGEGYDRALEFGPEFMGQNRRGAGSSRTEGELVFVGHGCQAPEYGWDDYKGLDCKGKVLVMLVGDPPTADATLFGGKAMTYYGRWTYKYDKALEMGAAGCLIVHRAPWAGYGWEVVVNSGARPKMRVREPDPSRHMGVEGWITWAVTQELLAKAGLDLDRLAEEAATREFKPRPLGLRLRSSMTNTSEDLDDANVCGVLPGSDPALSPEWLIFTAHYDHLGMGTPEAGKDVIYNGAIDNATGCAALLTIAEAMAKKPHPRSAMFLFVSSEEQGLLGSEWYSEHPIVPIARTVANINIDGMSVYDRTEDLQIVGYGQSDLDRMTAEELARDGRRAVPDQEPEKGLYYRSDHFNFARVGIPALYTKTGDVVPGRAADWLVEIKNRWTRENYHAVTDEFHADWPLAGGIADCAVLLRVAERILAGETPKWSESSEFRDRR